ncbi:MAG: NAD-dependent epimerase/dehydratase family protein [Desulfovibrionales bacterium]|nr:NAD-dependent epimerase/dehydratase family protein [Desulfovibrionales bacterium]
MQNILITGAAGFIGNALCRRLASGNKVIGVYYRKGPANYADVSWEQTDLTDVSAVAAVCEKYSPDVVIHCAGIAHQKIGSVNSPTYMRVNSEATGNLAKAASQVNPDVRFIFLSSVSVYGEGPGITSRKDATAQKRKNYNGISENGKCQPSSDYARSKLGAEKRLVALADEGILNGLVILRLAPVYDREWSFNLNRRVLAPLTITYIRFGSGLQRMSALARPNLVDFVEFLIKSKLATDAHRHIGRKKEKDTGVNILNVCDAEPYEFNTIIQVFKSSGARPNRPVISVPLSVVRFATRMAGCLLPDRKRWLYSCYDKLASSLVFDNERMLKTGFRPRHSLQTIFQSTD